MNAMRSKHYSAAPICQSRHLAKICAEGYLGCGIRIAPYLHLSPCILRKELALNLLPLVSERESKKNTIPVDNLLLGSALS